MEDLRQEYVLVQAWKKAHDYVRTNNWYGDVLDLALSNVRLPSTIKSIEHELQNTHNLKSQQARLVLAPKSTPWEVSAKGWQPKKNEKQRLRPLAHVSIRDQVIATAFLMCIADKLETSQGNPEWDFATCRRKGMVSYGHRLLTDQVDDRLHYRWGNAVYYRGYFQDYKSFINRPYQVIEEVFSSSQDWVIVSADLSQFYDRVRPSQLYAKTVKLLNGEATKEFLDAFKGFFYWNWHQDDVDDALKYAQNAEPLIIEGFDKLALPQGLAASGFFANLFLVDFDKAVVGSIGKSIGRSWQIVDYCRYVDDLRLVLRLSSETPVDQIQKEITQALQGIATISAPGVLLNERKTSLLSGRNASSRIVVLAESMKAIQTRVSGTIDLAGGRETLAMLEGLFAHEPEESPATEETKDKDPFFNAFHDVKDETIARFSANRFRKTYRLTRSLAPSEVPKHMEPYALTQETLDKRAAYFAQRLIWRWLKDPSNIRLLRVSLDLFPNPEAAKRIISLLKPHLEGKSRKDKRKVVEYCAAEVFKSAASEIGMRVDQSQRPDAANPMEVQKIVSELAKYVIEGRERFPWYVIQQALLLLAVTGDNVDISCKANSPPEWKHYLLLHQTLRGLFPFGAPEQAVQFIAVASNFSSDRGIYMENIAKAIQACSNNNFDKNMFFRILIAEDQDLASQIWHAMDTNEKTKWCSIFASCELISDNALPDNKNDLPISVKTYSVAQVAQSSMNPFRQEYLALRFLEKLLTSENFLNHGVLTPWDVSISANWTELLQNSGKFIDSEFTIKPNNIPAGFPVPSYDLPEWINTKDRWRYQYGQLLRALIIGNLDYTCNGTNDKDKSLSGFYRHYSSHWYRRRYGLYNGRSGLGPDWLPVSGWLVSLLSRLLAWPGFNLGDDETELGRQLEKKTVLKAVRKRIRDLRELYGKASDTLVIPIEFGMNSFQNSGPTKLGNGRFLRVAIVQTVLPTVEMIKNDMVHPSHHLKKELRQHLSATMATVHSMLLLRESHRPMDGRLDLLVLPELAVGVEDVTPVLIPFIQQHRCIIFAGLTYHQPFGLASPSFVNSALWLLPIENSTGGLQVIRVEQGKAHLAPEEREFQRYGLKGWRPCQFVLLLKESGVKDKRPWAITGSICYDATDLSLASDLKNRTDTWVVAAKNRDVGLFDSMIGSLHYHMYQHVILCNSGEFGGSTVQAPFYDRHQRTITHHHGNDQVAISFFELDLDTYKRARRTKSNKKRGELKSPPAAYKRHG